jgi:lysophospholipid acyltransferase (LPLAT)-like uncharacterized protein
VTAEDQPRFTLIQRLALAVVPRLVWALLSIWGRTWRFEVIAEEGASPVLFAEKSPPEIFCFWHQCVLPAAVYFRHSLAVILVSQSFDGELISRISKIFGYDTVRGSSTRGGREGLLGLTHILQNGRTAIFAADGPRGPAYQTKMGPIKLAQMTGAPIGIFFLEPEHAWVLNSWDRFLVPKPFTRICVSWTKAMCIPSDLSPEWFEPKREELNAALERARMSAIDHFRKAK